ncbi:membrane-anchored junction protein isoform X2 [Coturnix japonica]|uniref:membrane-anchored junction protein isoform X2 n=1 Tax=Coturnix japonica TaxID=93934 RepID=UPI0013A5D9F4|nr:membrane-anchored junction protein isoform X2 [Coturnix japonica]
MPLKPFAYPLPETRFLHAGGIVYKFKIRYGNLQSAPELNNTEIAVKEFEEAIRVILGNLDDLHPFSTDHFTIFPYLSKWERVSEMRFEHKNVDLVPYPYICTMYLELNSFQQSLSLGKEVNSDTSEPVKRKSEIPETTEMEEMVKRRRTEGQMETSYPVLCMDSPGAESAHRVIKAEHRFDKNYAKEIQCEHNPSSLSMGCKQESLWRPVGNNMEQRAESSQPEGGTRVLQPMDQITAKGIEEPKPGALSKLWRRLLSPLQHLFGGKH